MLKDQGIENFFYSAEFNDMLVRVGNDDMISYKNDNDWIPEHPSTALIFDQPVSTWENLNTEYNTNFKDLVNGDLPTKDQLVSTLENCLIG